MSSDIKEFKGGKISPRSLSPYKKEYLRQELERACECIRNKKDFPLFLDLLTESEQVMLARRILIAKRLIAGKTIQDIRTEIEVGQATVESVERFLSSRFAEYRKILPTLVAEVLAKASEDRRKQPIVPYSFRWVRRKYPLHFLVFNMVIDDIDWNKGRPPKFHPVSYVPIVGKERKKILARM